MNCPICAGVMVKIEDSIKQDGVTFNAYRCSACGEELMDMQQLKEMATKYRVLRKAKEITFVKWGNSLAVRIPQTFAKELKVKEGDTAYLKKSKNGLEIVKS